MRTLFDANVLIALMDEDHISHEVSFELFEVVRHSGWATCPLTENASLRVLSNPRYSQIKRFSLSQLTAKLWELTTGTDHEFWPDDISLLDNSVIAAEWILGPKQLTDVYMLALAAKRYGRLATFDTRIPMAAVKIATTVNLHIL